VARFLMAHGVYSLKQVNVATWTRAGRLAVQVVDWARSLTLWHAASWSQSTLQTLTMCSVCRT